jgi:hypothetical protein
MKHTYCSQWCKQGGTGVGSGGATRGKELVPRRNCELCGNKFYAEPKRVARGGGRFCSTACRVRNIGMNPANFPQLKPGRWRGGKRADLEDRYFRSSWEANYARYLNWLVAHGQIRGWEYEVDTFEFPIKRGSKFYTPDFKVVENDGRVVYHEVKGYMRPESATKLKRMRIHHPMVEVLLIDRDVYYALQRQVSALIDGWERAA